MDFSSLPRYRAFQRSPFGVGTQRGSPGFAPRTRRMLRELALVVTFGVVLWQLRQMTAANNAPPAPLSPPLDFRLIEKRFDQVQRNFPRQKVEQLLGPPSDYNAWGPDLMKAEEAISNYGKNSWFPNERVWHRWSDPKDPGRWVAVLYSGSYPERKVFSKIKKGF